jgi:ABC-2 type transport system permease protein
MMRTTIYLKDLRDQRRGFIGWSIGVILTVGIMGAFWPFMKDMPDIAAFVETYPEAFRKLFQIEAMTSGAGFFNVELFSMMLPIIFLVFGISRGARLVAGEEEVGTLEALASVSVPRYRILLDKALALVTTVSGLGLVTFLATWVTSALFGMEVPTGEALISSAVMAFLGIEFGLIALAIGALTGHRGLALGTASALAVASYLLYVAGVFIEEVETWRILSPFQQALAGGPIGGGWRAVFLWMPMVGMLAAAASGWRFDRRDLSS